MRSRETLTVHLLITISHCCFLSKNVRIIWAQSVFTGQRVSDFSIDDDDVSTFGLPVDHGARFKS